MSKQKEDQVSTEEMKRRAALGNKIVRKNSKISSSESEVEKQAKDTRNTKS